MDPAEVFVIVFWGILLAVQDAGFVKFLAQNGCVVQLCPVGAVVQQHLWALPVGRLAAAETREALHD